MNRPLHNPRTPEAEVDCMFYDRWSPRAFLPDPISEHQLRSLFEAARWAPSCFNEQPWIFIHAISEEDRARFLTALVEKNRAWARQAPLLIFLATRNHFTTNGKPNRHAKYDAGAAWMALSLQARRLGLYAHAMAGFDQEKAYEILDLPQQEYTLCTAIAVGRRGPDSQLPDDLRQMETPNSRKPLSDIVLEGKFTPSQPH